jgi:hypothetical protein
MRSNSQSKSMDSSTSCNNAGLVGAVGPIEAVAAED